MTGSQLITSGFSDLYYYYNIQQGTPSQLYAAAAARYTGLTQDAYDEALALARSERSAARILSDPRRVSGLSLDQIPCNDGPVRGGTEGGTGNILTRVDVNFTPANSLEIVSFPIYIQSSYGPSPAELTETAVFDFQQQAGMGGSNPKYNVLAGDISILSTSIAYTVRSC